MCEESPPPPTAEISQENQVKKKKKKNTTKAINKAKQLLFTDTMEKPASWRIFFHNVK